MAWFTPAPLSYKWHLILCQVLDFYLDEIAIDILLIIDTI